MLEPYTWGLILWKEILFFLQNITAMWQACFNERTQTLCLGRSLSDTNWSRVLNRHGLVTFPPTAAVKQVSSVSGVPGPILVLTEQLSLHLYTEELSRLYYVIWHT